MNEPLNVRVIVEAGAWRAEKQLVEQMAVDQWFAEAEKVNPDTRGIYQIRTQFMRHYTHPETKKLSAHVISEKKATHVWVEVTGTP